MSQPCGHCGKWTCQVCGGPATLLVKYNPPESGVMGAFVKSKATIEAFCVPCYEPLRRDWSPKPVEIQEGKIMFHCSEEDDCFYQDPQLKELVAHVRADHP